MCEQPAWSHHWYASWEHNLLTVNLKPNHYITTSQDIFHRVCFQYCRLHNTVLIICPTKPSEFITKNFWCPNRFYNKSDTRLTLHFSIERDFKQSTTRDQSQYLLHYLHFTQQYYSLLSNISQLRQSERCNSDSHQAVRSQVTETQ